jgi:hypothetical protein
MGADHRVLLLRSWRGCVALFVLAALTGALLRGSFAWAWDLGVATTNVRHAHSHLMLFGWVTPAIMTLIAARLPREIGRPVSGAMIRAIAATWLLGVLSYPAFGLFGYQVVTIGSARLPPAVIVSGAAIITWYAFVVAYVVATRGARRTTSLVAWDLALAVLVASSLAAWMLALLRPLGLDPLRWTPILTHAFLDPFVEGWLVVAVLGLAHSIAPRTGRGHVLALLAIAASAPLAFGLGLAPGTIAPSLRIASTLSAIVWAGAVTSQLARFAPVGPLRTAVAIGTIGVVARLLAALTPWIDWASVSGLRLLYLHLLLLGTVTLALFAVARVALGSVAVGAPRSIEVSVALVLASMVPLTDLWPRSAPLPNAAALAAILAFGPALAALASLLRAPRGPAEEITPPTASPRSAGAQ